ncbi:MAG: undecaprenyl-diphosphate phosphatase [Lachnospiraceae bacterium]|nr:undecaprenyl-diphosphate phosphatase [Lachnospiraceae bacterium]
MNFFEFLKIVILGIAEGITEFLPISSTGHLLLLERLLRPECLQDEAFSEIFTVVVQLGAILAVMLIFFRQLWPLGMTEEKRVIVKGPKVYLWVKIGLACIPAAIAGLLFDNLFDKLFHGRTSTITVMITLILYGIVFLFIEKYSIENTPRFRTLGSIPMKLAVYIGCFQILAMIPGTSRSGITIIGAMLLGASRGVATEFTFFLEIPTIIGASLWKLLKYNFDFDGMQYAILLTAMLVAFLVAFATVNWMIDYVKKHDFKVFGWYRIGLGLLIFVILLIT